MGDELGARNLRRDQRHAALGKTQLRDCASSFVRAAPLGAGDKVA
jgi:hypothetical protein